MEIERNLGKQPIAQIMLELNLKSQDLVGISEEQITHKMVTRACKGRRLTPNVKSKILNALQAITKKEYSINKLFNY